MSDYHLYVALSFFCLAGAALVLFIRSGTEIKKRKRELDGIEKRLNEFKPPQDKPTDTEDSNESSLPR